MDNTKKLSDEIVRMIDTLTDDSKRTTLTNVPQQQQHPYNHQPYPQPQPPIPYTTLIFQDIMKCFKLDDSVLKKSLIKKKRCLGVKRLYYLLLLKYNINLNWLKDYLKRNPTYRFIVHKGKEWVHLVS